MGVTSSYLTNSHWFAIDSAWQYNQGLNENAKGCLRITVCCYAVIIKVEDWRGCGKP